MCVCVCRNPNMQDIFRLAGRFVRTCVLNIRRALRIKRWTSHRNPGVLDSVFWDHTEHPTPTFRHLSSSNRLIT